jgi:1,4-dihydroxy-2-naphthoate octaprenyltransferase
LWVSLPLGLLITAFLLVNEFPDHRADLAAGKRNLVVRLGRRRASLLLPLVYLLAFGLLALLPRWTGLPTGVWGGYLAAPLAIFVCVHTLRRPEDFYRSQPVQPAALLAFCAYALGSAVGIMVG